jgi:hypothetical protein
MNNVSKHLSSPEYQFKVFLFHFHTSGFEEKSLISGWREIAIFFVGKTQISLSVEELRLVRFEIFQQGN